MCERLSFITKISVLAELYRIDTSVATVMWQRNVNISKGDQALVLTCEEPQKLQLMNFGYTPHWARSRMDILNARSEGDHNKANDPRYNRAKGIIRKPAFRKAIRNQRCVIFANGFILGDFKSGKSEKFYFVYRYDRKPITLAGIYDYWQDPITNEITSGFAIITTTANELIQKTGHMRSPVILKPGDQSRWLHPGMHLAGITERLIPFHPGAFNAHPISPLIFSSDVDGINIIKPIGSNISKRQSVKFEMNMRLQGMGSTAGRERRKHEDEIFEKRNQIKPPGSH